MGWSPPENNVGTLVREDAYSVGADTYFEPFALRKLKSNCLYSEFVKSIN